MQSVEDVFKHAMSEVERIINTEIMVGQSISVGETTIIPLVSIGFGFGVGAKSRQHLNEPGADSSIGGTGGGAGIKPVAVIVVDKSGVRVDPLTGTTTTLLAKAGEIAGNIAQQFGEEKRRNRENRREEKAAQPAADG